MAGEFGGGPVEQMPPSLLQMAQGVAPAMGGGGQNWAPDWVREQLPANLAAYAASSGTPPGNPGDAFGPVDSGAGLGFSGVGKLAPWLNPENWGPPPAVTNPMPGVPSNWFPREFGRGDPNDKFWSQKGLLQAYNQKFPGGQMPEVMDERPNTRNSRLLGGGPGDFMYLGHHINQAKLQEDLHQGLDPSGEGGSNRPPIRRVSTLGPEFPAIFQYGTGRVGLPGQLEPWMHALDPPK